MTRDPVKLARALVLLGWAALFDWLWLADRANSYIGPRTTWVITFGAIALTVVALAYLAGAVRPAPPRRLSAREVGRLAVLAAPILGVAMAPNSSLGALAVKKKGLSSAIVAAQARYTRDRDAPLNLYDLAVVSRAPGYAKKRGIRDGQRVDFDGFVSEEGEQDIQLSRFMATCCAADAVPYSIRVTPPAGSDRDTLALDAWLRVRGTIRQKPDRSWSVEVKTLDSVPRPDNPYGPS